MFIRLFALWLSLWLVGSLCFFVRWLSLCVHPSVRSLVGSLVGWFFVFVCSFVDMFSSTVSLFVLFANSYV